MRSRHRLLVQLLGGFVALATSLAATPGRAAPVLRFQVEQRGDFVLIGNALGWDCSPGVPRPVVGTVADGDCGANTADTSPDLFWRSDQPAGGATANRQIGVADARSTALLALPPGAQITYARLYWGAYHGGVTADTTATIERPGQDGFSMPLTADQSSTAVSVPMMRSYYQSSADVTSLVVAKGPGAFRVGGVDTLPLADLNEFTVYSAWWMVVFYRLDSEPQRNLALFDGLDEVNTNSFAAATLSGFLVPSTGFDGKLGVVAYEGDDQANGDQLAFNGIVLSDDQNPIDNFFNGTRSLLGKPVSVAGDLPQSTGAPRSLSSMDLDVVDVTKILKKGDTQATIAATSAGDIYFLAGFVTSIASLKPEFSGSPKTVRDVTHPTGPVRPGDTVEYTIEVVNSGNDPALDVVLTDPLPMGLSYVPGSTTVLVGPNAGSKTDAVGDDQAEYEAATRTVRVRLGAGASAASGGQMAIGESVVVTFRATIDAGTMGTLFNQGTVTARGQSGNPSTSYSTDGNGGGAGNPATALPIDECGVDADCTVPARPYCITRKDPNICAACRDDRDCPSDRPICSASRNICVPMCATDEDCGPAAPVCLPNGTCGQCTAADRRGCSGTALLCEEATNRCVECLDDSTCPMARPKCDLALKICGNCVDNSACGGITPVCDVGTRLCRACAGDGECGGTTPACQATGACAECSATNATLCKDAKSVCDPAQGRCVACVGPAQCPTMAPVCDATTRTCRGCANDTECGGSTPACVGGLCLECSAQNKSRCLVPTAACSPGGRCVACAANADCPTEKPVCDLGTFTCRGCSSGAECPAANPVCLASGRCGECSATDKSRCMGATPLCDVTQGRCVTCLGNADCGGTTPTCRDGRCAACATDGAPDCSDATRPACQKSGALAGACTECSDDNRILCGGARPLCLAALGLCGCTDIDGDHECGVATSGLVCSGPAGICVPGCSTAPDRNACPAGQMCSDVTGKVGRCQALLGCGSNADCAAPRPFCDVAVVPRACVQCLDDGQCPSGLVCDATGSKSCVECTPAKTARCQAPLSGARCLPTLACGCVSDSDCGGATSGRVCDATLAKCVFGCRGLGGNGCGAGLACSSTTTAIGRCGSGDGGAPDAGGRDAVADAPAPRDAATDGARDAVVDGARDAALDRPATDGAPLADAGREAGRPDAAPGGDAASGDASSDGPMGHVGGGGCSCTTPGQGAPSAPLPAGVVALFIVGIVWRRRR